MGFLEKANAGVWGIECDAGGAGAKPSIQGPDRKVGTERVEARLRDDGGDRPPANESCMEWQGLATQPRETLIRKSTLSANLSHRKWLEEST
jgi:hypothetical protein